MTTPTIPAIETWYHGCKFRSRLEARWAVFLDHLRIRWEYEPEGYLVGQRRKPYLPDFWLPGERIWVEVKGSNTQLDVELMAAAARPEDGLPDTGNVQAGHSARLLILGPVGKVGGLSDDSGLIGYVGPAYTVLTAREGVICQGSAYFTGAGLEVVPGDGQIAGPDGAVRWDACGHKWGNLVGAGCYITGLSEPPDASVADAYRAARSARFEHGESGAAK